MDIKRKKKEKRIQLFGALIGICVAVVSLLYFFHAEKAEAEKRLVEIVNYVKVQCSTYTHYNESSESKSLLRAIESARQMSTNINMETENGGQLSRDFLKETCRLSGWMVSLYWIKKERRIVNTARMNLLPMRLRSICKKKLSWILPDMKKDLIRNVLLEKTGRVSTLQPVPEKMHRVSLLFIIIHLRNLSETTH